MRCEVINLEIWVCLFYFLHQLKNIVYFIREGYIQTYRTNSSVLLIFNPNKIGRKSICLFLLTRLTVPFRGENKKIIICSIPLCPTVDILLNTIGIGNFYFLVIINCMNSTAFFVTIFTHIIPIE